MNKNRRICFVADSFISDTTAMITGPMVQTYLIGSELSKRGWEVHYVAYTRKFKEKAKESFEGMTIHWIPQRRYLPILNYFSIYRELSAIGADYHYQRGRDLLTGFVGRFCRRHGKVFVWASAGENGVEKGKYIKQFQRKKRAILKKVPLFLEAMLNDLVCEYGITHATHRIVQTEAQKALLYKTFGLAGTVIQSGHPVPEAAERSLPLKILWIGSIKPVKRPDLFIQLAKACSDLPCEFWLAGQFMDENTKSLIIRELPSAPNVKYLGAIPFHESHTLINKAHVLVNTTEDGFEGLPNSFVQAWLSGTITMSLYADPDNVIKTHGLGYQTESIPEMKKKIVHLLQNLHLLTKMSEEVRLFGRKRFSIEEITNQLSEIMTSDFMTR